MPSSTVIIDYSLNDMKKLEGHSFFALIMSSLLVLQDKVKPFFLFLAIDIISSDENNF